MSRTAHFHIDPAFECLLAEASALGRRPGVTKGAKENCHDHRQMGAVLFVGAVCALHDGDVDLHNDFSEISAFCHGVASRLAA
jgi:hypothetical protein